MDLEAWQVLAWLTFLTVVYGLGVVLLDAPASIPGFVVLVVFGAAGLIAGRFLADRISGDR